MRQRNASSRSDAYKQASQEGEPPNACRRAGAGRNVQLGIGLALVMAAVSAESPSRAPGLWEPVWAYLDAPEAEAAELLEGILAGGTSAADLAEVVRSGPVYPDEFRTGTFVPEIEGADGNAYTFGCHVPESYDPGKAHPLLVFLHGAVRNTQGGFGPRHLGIWREAAEERGWIVACPNGFAGAEWWEPAGGANVHRTIDWIAARYNVDENRIWLSGFSDGASGAFRIAAGDPDRFAGFLPVCGHPQGTIWGSDPAPVGNLLNRPFLLVTGGLDGLFATAKIAPFTERLAGFGVPIEHVDDAEAGHNWNHVDDLKPRMIEWLAAHPRDPLPETVDLSATEPGADVAWLRIDALDPERGEADFPGVDPIVEPARLGVNLVDGYRGPGIRLAEVAADTPAEAAGLQAGDVLLQIDENEIASVQTVVAFLRGLDEEQPVTLRIEREGTPMEIEARLGPRSVDPFPLPEGTGRLRARRDGNRVIVESRGVARFSLLVPEGMFDPEMPVVVEVDGAVTWEGTVEPNPRFLLEEARRRDREFVPIARIAVDVPAD